MESTDPDEIIFSDDDESLKKRGGCLTAFLLFLIVVNAGTSLFYLLGADFLVSRLHGFQTWQAYVLAAAGIINLVFLIMVYQWKKFGLYGIIGMSIIILAFNVYLGMGANAVLGLIGPIVLILVLRPVWKYMK